MRLPIRLSVLCFIGILVAGSTALGYYYYYVYSPPLKAAEMFMDAMESGDSKQLALMVVIGVGIDSNVLRPAREEEIVALLRPAFQRGRVLDQKKREGDSQTYHSLVYREPDGQVYAVVVTKFKGHYRVVIPESPMSDRRLYLWDYTWTN